MADARPAPRNPWLQTASGRAFDLVEPMPGMVDFEVDIPEALARIPRFTGHVRGGAYSVAQHSVIGANALQQETGRRDLAAAFLLHDAHEAYIGDIATPIGPALADLAVHASPMGVNADLHVRRALHLMKAQLDRAIHDAAGIEWPLPDDVARAVKEMDLRMLATERRQVLGPAPARWDEAVEAAKPIRMTGKLRIWPWPQAADAFRTALRNLIPSIPNRAA